MPKTAVTQAMLPASRTSLTWNISTMPESLSTGISMLPTENPRARKTARGSITDMNMAAGSRSARSSSV